MKPENKKLNNGPAATVTKRAHNGAPCIVLRLELDSQLPDLISICGALAKFLSPKNFTYPPSGTAEICHLVPFLSFKDNNTGPKPIENTSARIPLNFPT